VGEAVQAAGLADDAMPDALNLAAPLTDGQRLVVPRQGEPPPAEPASTAPRAASARATSNAPNTSGAPARSSAGAGGQTAPSGTGGGRNPGGAITEALAPGAKLNLNTASAAQLDALPGIGPAYAQRILDYRERNGPFRTVQQLHDARIIPNATYERLKDRLSVD
jgi:competence protein ComEA